MLITFLTFRTVNGRKKIRNRVHDCNLKTYFTRHSMECSFINFITLYWPHMDVDIAHAAASCEECVSQLPSLPAEPLQHHEPATRPF
jgi:hypothetical protein